MARACGSYPQCHWFDSSYRHQKDSYRYEPMDNENPPNGGFFCYTVTEEGRRKTGESKKKAYLFPYQKNCEGFFCGRNRTKNPR